MATTIKLRRGTNANRTGITPAEGELLYTTDTKKLYVGDGSTAGGIAVDTDTVYTLPAATSTVRGGIELGSDTQQTTAANGVTSTASRTYALQVNAAGQGVVNVPWTDNNTTYSAATTTTLGLVKLEDAATQTTAANAVTTTASRTYGVQFNASQQLVVNVPWTDTNTTYTGGTGLALSGTTFNLDFSELTDMTADISGTTEFILQNGTTESRKAASEIKLSAFNNDLPTGVTVDDAIAYAIALG